MALIETAIGLLLKTAGQPVADSVVRREHVARLLVRVNLASDPPKSDFPSLYVYTLIEHCYGMPKATIDVFRDRYIRDAFIYSFSYDDWTRLSAELETVLTRNWEDGGEFGRLGPADLATLRQNFQGFTEKFHNLVDKSRTAAEARIEFKVDQLSKQLGKWEKDLHASATPLRPAEVVSDPRFTPDPRLENIVLRNDGWIKSLHQLYPDYPLIEIVGSTFPIWAEQAPRGEWERLESPLGELDESLLPSYSAYNESIGAGGATFKRDYDPDGESEFNYNLRMADAKTRHNSGAFTYTGLRRDDQTGGLRLDARPGTYFDSVVTSEMLEREFINAQSEDPSSEVSIDLLQRRNYIRQNVTAAGSIDEVVDGRFRAAALSVAATIILVKPRGNHSALLVRRSDEVLTHRGFHHVAPSGILAPASPNWDDWLDEFSIERNVLREYAEELFGYEELEVGVNRYGAGLYHVPPIRRLLAAKDKDVKIVYCGISIPLLTLRPEINVLFLIDNSWFENEQGIARYADRKAFKLNWEYRAGGGKSDTKLSLDRDFNPIDPGGLTASTAVSNAAAAIRLSTTVAREIAGD